MKHIKKFELKQKINEGKESIDPVESIEVHTSEWDDEEDFGITKKLVIKTKSGKIYKAKLELDDDDYDGPEL